MNGDKVFLDTNIIIYAYDVSAGEKHKIASKIYKGLWNSGRGVISTQVLQEFYVAVTRKLAVPLSPEIAENVVRNLTALPLIQIDSALVLTAIGKSLSLGFSFWDALIIASALSGGAECLFTEDLQHGQIIDGMRIGNHFV